MNVKQLKIGNWVHHNVSIWSYRNNDGVISNFDDNFQWNESDWYALGECTLTEDCIEPILLTEDWLPKFGFSCETIQGNQNEFRVYTKGQFVYNTNHGWWINGKQIKVQPKYVHRLQNLYFETEDIELTLSVQ
jgi:hypothetical protein